MPAPPQRTRSTEPRRSSSSRNTTRPQRTRASSSTNAPNRRNRSSERNDSPRIADLVDLYMRTRDQVTARPLTARPRRASAQTRPTESSTFRNPMGDPALTRNAPMSLDDLLERALGSLPGAQQAAPVSLVDVNALMGQYDAAEANVNKQADRSRGVLAELSANGQRDAQMVAEATQARLADLEAMRAAAGRAEVEATRSRREGGIADLQAQGVDPSVIASAQLDQQAAVSQAQAASADGAALVNDQQSQAKIDAARRQDDLRASDRNASTYLDQQLVNAMLQLQGDRLGARTEAERYNADALSQQQQAQFAMGQEQAQLRSQLPAALMEAVGAQDGFLYPERDAAMADLMRMGEDGPASWKYLVPQYAQALRSADNPDDAMESILNALNAYDAQRQDAGQTPYKISQVLPRIQALVDRYYRQDTNQIDPRVAETVLRGFGGI